MARIEVHNKVSRHGSSVIGDQDEAVLLSPEEDFGVRNAERKFSLLSHASDLEREGAPGVDSSHGRPERTAKVLVENVSQRHESGSIGVERRRPLTHLQSIPYLGYAWRMRAGAAQLI
jgi:hypothetical protein